MKKAVYVECWIHTPRTHHCLHDKQGMEDVIFKEKTIAAKALWPSIYMNYESTVWYTPSLMSTGFELFPYVFLQKFFLLFPVLYDPVF